MTDADILSRFTRILRDLLGDESIVLRRETVRSEVPGWDSFAYINFIAMVEAELGIKFRIADVEAFENVGDIVANAKTLLK